MSLGIIVPDRDVSKLKNKLTELLPEIKIWEYSPEMDKEKVEVLILWKHPKGILNQFPNLKWVSSLGAGVDHIVADNSLSSGIVVTRIVDEGLTVQMRKYVLMAVLAAQKEVFKFYEQKRNRQWFSNFSIDENSRIGIMGLGVLGMDVALHLKYIGFDVLGYSRTKKEIQGITTFDASELNDFISKTNILVCMLPLTSETTGILNLSLFKKMPPQSYLINVGRGKHLIENDLVKAIRLGYLKGACLDVFNEEPLPDDHPFWEFPEILITPHIASITNQEKAAESIAMNYLQLKNGMPLLNEVDLEKGY